MTNLGHGRMGLAGALAWPISAGYKQGGISRARSILACLDDKKREE